MKHFLLRVSTFLFLNKIYSDPKEKKSPFLSNRILSKRDISLLIGNALDHFDTALYSFLAPVLAPLFFRGEDKIVQLILAYSVLASSLVTRPIGVLMAGVIVRRFGPLSCLSYSLIGMAFATVAFAFLPVYTEIGWAATAGLLTIRILRGIFAASENTIARMYIMEDKEKAHQARASHFYESSTMMGIITASFLATVVIAYFGHSEVYLGDYLGDYFSSMAWRFCFGLGGIAGIIGFMLRRKTKNENSVAQIISAIDSEIPENRKMLNQEIKMNNTETVNKSPLLSILWQEKLNVLRVVLTASLSYITYSVPFIFLNSFVPLVTDISLETMMALSTSFLVFDMFMIPLMGKILLKFEGIKVMRSACLLLSISVLPLFYYLPGASLPYVTFLRVWIMFLGIVFLCPLNVWYKNLFSDRNADQFVLVGMGNTLGASTIGRLTPAICLWLWHSSQMVLFPAIFVASIALIVVYVLSDRTSLSSSTDRLSVRACV